MRTYAAWVEPVVDVLSADADEVRAFIASAPAGFWERSSVVEGWSNRDILAHMGGGNDQMVQTVLRAVLAGAELAPGDMEPDTDAENAARVADRRSWALVDVVSEYQAGVEEMRDLLARLTDAHEGAQLGGTSLTLGKLLRIVQHERHDHLHLEQLRSALADHR